MKNVLLFSILFCVIPMPVLGELTDADLNKIRLIVKEEIKVAKEEIKSEITEMNKKIGTIDERLRTVETGVAELRGRDIALSIVKDWIVPICAIAAIVISIIALRETQSFGTPTPQDTQKALS